MPYSPILLVHISAGTLGLMAGTAAMIFRKGSHRHALAGRIFVVAMLTMASIAVYLATVRHQRSNISGGIFTFISDRHGMVHHQAQRRRNGPF